MAKSIMIQGTASGVGKTILTTALCRIFAQDGHKVAPFKSQNMTSNTAVIKNEQQIAISQLLQAKAAKIEADSRMNPVVLSPSQSRNGTQVILDGKPFDIINAYNFKTIKQKLKKHITFAYKSLASEYDIIVIEGAGSPCELNLNNDDIVNMGVAKIAKSPVILVSNIDRGGVFASLYGTIKLLGDDANFIKATIVNRFKGNLELFDEGKTILENITERPVAGIVPYFEFNLPEEDDLYSGKNLALSDVVDSEFDRIAENIRKSVDMKLIYAILNRGI